ncbi:hypothetical protein JW935_05510 [candidate division KSB1 bacterium]|nr:hypothetical protein [candidate division KSB1 bacterium]
MQDFESFKYRRRKRPAQSTGIILLIFAFAVILGLLSTLRKNWSVLDQLPGEQQTGVADSVYVHQSSFLSVTAPAGWLIHETGDTTVATVDTNRTILPQITWLIDMVPPPNGAPAKTRVGVLQWPVTAPARKIAIEILFEMLGLYEENGRRIRNVVPVTGPAHRILQGVYFVSVVPGDSVDMPVRIFSVLPRQQFAYVISSRCREADYPFLKGHFEGIVKRFNPLPMSELF